MGPEHGWYKVGPLARVQNCDSISTPFAEHERREFVDYAGGSPLHAPLAYHWARMIEMLHAAEVIKELLHDDDLSGTDLMVEGERGARASASSRRRAARSSTTTRSTRTTCHHGQPDRLDHQQQPGDERGGASGGDAT
jgi:coenzyme F420-reducing hydrogenase alpha subunit